MTSLLRLAARALGLSVLAAGLTAASAQVSITTPGSAYTQDFNTLANSGTTNTIVPSGWAFAETGTNANSTYSAATGTATTGDTYSFGAASATDRAFGGLQSGSVVPTIGAGFKNNTGLPIQSLAIAYTGEQWRLGTAGRADRMDFQYSLDATSLSTGTWTDVDALDFTAPNMTGTASLDGNAAANRVAVSSTISSLAIPVGATFWIRWTDFNATGADDGLGVDDFSLTATSGPATQTLGVNAGEDNDAGYRMLSAPVSGLTVAYLIGQNLVQGIPGEFPTFGTNLFTAYNGQGQASGYLAPAGTSTALEPGKGFVWYLYDQTFDPDPGNTAGSSESFALPRALSATGTASATAGSYSPSAFPLRTSGADDFFLMGNPFAGPLDLNGVSVSAGTLQNSVYIYDPGISNYQVISANAGDAGSNVATDDIAVWQGFFGQVTAIDVTTVAVTPSYNTTFIQTSTPTFYGRSEGGAAVATARDVRFRLDGQLTSGATTVDVANALQFQPGASAAWDAFDLMKLGPATPSYALLALRGANPAGGVGEKGVESRELDPTAPFVLPVAMAASEAGTFTLSWTGIETLPSGWTLSLRDLVTDATVDLRAAPSYTFTADGGSYAERFALTVTSSVVATEPGAAVATLGPVVPNPASGRAALVLTSPTSERVTAEVFDALGRRVATLFDGTVSAGVPTALSVEASALSAGAYVVRVTGATFVATRRLTVVR